MITCYKCNETKPDSDFNWYDKKRGKRQTMCRKCFSEYNKKRYASDPDRFKADARKYKRENPASVLETRIRICAKNPTSRNAARVVEAALNSGALTRQTFCSGCGASSDDVKIEAHHSDYTKPLSVVWLCPSCHSVLDIERRRREGKPYYSQCKKVICVETGTEYESIKLAASDVGVSCSSLSQCLSGKSSTSAGFHWKYASEVI